MGLHCIIIEINVPCPNPALVSLRTEVFSMPLVLLAVSTESAHSRLSVLDGLVSALYLFFGPEMIENSRLLSKPV